MNKLTHSRTSVYNIGYHIVWSVKYRVSIINGNIEKTLRETLYKVAEEKGFQIKALELMQDHVHVFVSAKPKISPGYIYRMLKGISARRIFREHPEIKKKLWNPSTYVETVGHISESAVKKYIQDQKKK